LDARSPYFLGIDVARDVVEGWIRNAGYDPGPSAICRRVTECAINDA
jgi:hypothetical protein